MDGSPIHPENERSKDKPRKLEAVRTTIVGGRPSGSGKNLGDIPRGIEVLVKKASVDPEFKKLLLEKRAVAAAGIDLALDPAETAMLNGVPATQLEAIISRTSVSRESRAVFLGRAAAAMLAALGVGALASCEPSSRGVRPDRPDPGKVRETPRGRGTLEIQADRADGENVREPRQDGKGTTPTTKHVTPTPTPKGVRPDRPPRTKGIRP